jgi:ABC-type transport system involved in cytochrome c biogenesis permease subunit
MTAVHPRREAFAMTPPISEQITATPPASTTPAVPRELPASTEPPAPKAPFSVLGWLRSVPLFWWLAGVNFLVTVGIGVFIYFIFFTATTYKGEEKKLAVPFADNTAILQPYHQLVVQHDGRIKPFESFCKDTVRSITGREKFEGKDPVAIVLSWIMLFEPEKNDFDKADNNAINEASRKLMDNRDWDNHPFILCEYQKLREELYKEYTQKDDLTDEQKHGKYIEPRVLRTSEKLKEHLRSGAAKRAKDSKAVVDLIESKALEVKNRLDLYERVRSGGEIETGSERMHVPGEYLVASLDKVGPTWFSLKGLRYLLAPPVKYGPHGEKKIEGATAWAEVMEKRRIDYPDFYEGTAKQEYPEKTIKEVLAAFQGAQAAYRTGDADKFSAASKEFLDTLAKTNAETPTVVKPELIERELWFNKLNPFQKAWIVSLSATLLLALSVLFAGSWSLVSRILYGLGMVVYIGALGYAITGFFCRVTISGRPPVSNMYESIIWVAFMTAVFGFGLELVYRKGIIALAGAMVSTIGFVLADQLPTVFSPSIDPLVAVLRSNYWLVIHVITIVSSYAAFALAWGLGNFNLAFIMFRPQSKDTIKTLSLFSYRAIQVGVVLLFLGTMLGGVWAAESWGRLWGWDRKEVWALIAFLCYIIPLHARYIGWVKDFGLAACAVVCFSAVVMAWYGVNFVLGAGMHTYGFGNGNNSWVYLVGLINIHLVLDAAMRYTSRQKAAAANPAA